MQDMSLREKMARQEKLNEVEVARLLAGSLLALYLEVKKQQRVVQEFLHAAILLVDQLIGQYGTPEHEEEYAYFSFELILAFVCAGYGMQMEEGHTLMEQVYGGMREQRGDLQA